MLSKTFFYYALVKIVLIRIFQSTVFHILVSIIAQAGRQAAGAACFWNVEHRAERLRERLLFLILACLCALLLQIFRCGVFHAAQFLFEIVHRRDRFRHDCLPAFEDVVFLHACRDHSLNAALRGRRRELFLELLAQLFFFRQRYHAGLAEFPAGRCCFEFLRETFRLLDLGEIRPAIATVCVDVRRRISRKIFAGMETIEPLASRRDALLLVMELHLLRMDEAQFFLRIVNELDALHFGGMGAHARPQAFLFLSESADVLQARVRLLQDKALRAQIVNALLAIRDALTRDFYTLANGIRDFARRRLRFFAGETRLHLRNGFASWR